MTNFLILGDHKKNQIYQKIITYIAQKIGINIHIHVQPCPKENFEDFIDSIRLEYAVIELFSPIKHEAFLLADLPTERASPCQMANILYSLNGRLYADNTYGYCLCLDIENNLNYVFKNKRGLILCSNNNIFSCLLKDLAQKEVKEIYLASHSPERIACMIKDRMEKPCFLSSIHTQDIPSDFDFIINTTNVSLTQENCHEKNIIMKKGVLLYDMNYQKDNMLFFKDEEKKGTVINNGLSFLFERAIELINIYFSLTKDQGKRITMDDVFRKEERQNISLPIIHITENQKTKEKTH